MKCGIHIHEQSPDVAGAVKALKDDLDVRAGEQDVKFGYASDETHSMTTRLERNSTMRTRMMIYGGCVQDGETWTQATIGYALKSLREIVEVVRSIPQERVQQMVEVDQIISQSVSSTETFMCQWRYNAKYQQSRAVQKTVGGFFYKCSP